MSVRKPMGNVVVPIVVDALACLSTAQNSVENLHSPFILRLEKLLHCSFHFCEQITAIKFSLLHFCLLFLRSATDLHISGLAVG